jgi:hypothetical protein
MSSNRKRVEAVAYMRTSSATNVGADKDSEKRQRDAIERFASAPASWSRIGSTIRP